MPEFFRMTIDTRQIAEIQKAIKEIDPKLKRQLTKELRGQLLPYAKMIQGAVPSKAPLSGMTERWGSTKSSVRTFVNARPGRALATINISGDAAYFNRLLSITERAGSRTGGYTPSGVRMTRVLNDRFPMRGRGGRFVWGAFVRLKPEIVRVSIMIIDHWTTDLNNRLRVGL